MDIKNHDVKAAVLCAEGFKLSEFDLLGMTACERVAAGLSGAQCLPRSSLLQAVNNFSTSARYGLIVSEEYPLFDSQLLEEILEYCQAARPQALRFEGGIIFETAAAADIESLNGIMFKHFDSSKLIKLTEKTLPYIYNRIKNIITERHLSAGVIIPQPDYVYIDEHSVVGEGTQINAGCVLKRSTVGSGCLLDTGCTLEDSVLSDGVTVTSSIIRGGNVGAGTAVGPYSFIRPGTKVGKNCRVGDFVELKNSVLGDGTKVAHLAYVGDAQLGKSCNVGCGAVFVNYDGKLKQKSSVGDNVFIGSNCNIIAPVNVGEGSYLAAGTTVTENVPPFALCVGRSRQTVKPEWARARFES